MEEAWNRKTAPQAEASNANDGYKDGQAFPGQVAQTLWPAGAYAQT